MGIGEQFELEKTGRIDPEKKRDKLYDLVVYIGRFQLPHNGHVRTMQRALDIGRNVLVLVGSANRPSSPKNPWSADERGDIIDSIMDRLSGGRRHCVSYLNDHLYNDMKWIEQVRRLVHGVSTIIDIARPSSNGAKVAIIGYKKDFSSEYLTWFPGWDLVEIPEVDLMNATDVRNDFFSMYREDFPQKYEQSLPPETMEFLLQYRDTEQFRHLALWHGANQDVLKKDALYPYPLNKVTVDAVVIHKSGHVLVVERGGATGKGLLALPGGYLNTDETAYEGCIRELTEETEFNLHPSPQWVEKESAQDYTVKELERFFVTSRVFDHPQRSQLGRVMTHAHLFYIDTPMLPKVNGADDAAKAFWMPLEQVEFNSNKFFDDHYDIVDAMRGHLRRM